MHTFCPAIIIEAVYSSGLSSPHLLPVCAISPPQPVSGNIHIGGHPPCGHIGGQLVRLR